MQLSNIILNNPDYRSLWTAEIDGALSVGLSNPFAIVATIAAYNEGEPWLKQLLDYLDDNISFLKSFVAEHLPKVRVFEPEGTYLVWLDFRAYETDPVRLEDLVLKQAKVVLDEGYFFGDEGNGFERINIACPRQTLEDALVKIAAVFRIED
jgi:cystathionine beta-lyase